MNDLPHTSSQHKNVTRRHAADYQGYKYILYRYTQKMITKGSFVINSNSFYQVSNFRRTLITLYQKKTNTYAHITHKRARNTRTPPSQNI